MKNSSFKTRLFLLCGFLCLVSVSIGTTALFGLHKVSKSYEQVSDIALPSISNLGDMLAAYRNVRINLRTLGLPNLSKADAELAIKNLGEDFVAYEKANKLYTSNQFLPGEKELYDDVEKNWITFKGVGERVLTHYRNGTPEGKEKMTQIFFKDCPEASNSFTVSLLKLIQFQKDFSKTSVAEAKSASTSTHIAVMLTGIIGILSGLLLGFFFSNKISVTISKIVEDLRENALQVTAASTQIASASEELSQATTEQAASLEETAASVEEMNSMIAKTSENALSTASTSVASQKKVTEGKAIVESMTHSMEEISRSNTAIMKQVNESNQSMADIVKVIEEIDKKTKVINDIVNKTELLSFNASVEAARAGEHGKGFAVVAEEVGNLARMSGAAAEEIGSLLEKSKDTVNKTVQTSKSSIEKLINEGKETIERGAQVARQCGEVFDEVVQNVTSVSGMANEISSASQEQSRGCAEIAKAMSQLDQMTQQNAATSEECASAAEELSAQAEALKGSIDQLAFTVKGRNGEVHTAENQISFPAPTTRKSSAPQKVVHLKSPKTKVNGDVGPRLRKASGDVPDYDSDGFKDV